MMAAIGAMSRIKSKGSLSYSVALIAFGAPTISSVYPSGGARTTSSVPTLLPAPGRFSTTNCWPSRSESHWPTKRATMSVDPPGANGTIKRTGRVGYVCPFAMSGTTGRAAAPAARCRNRRRGSLMVLSQRSFCGTSLPVPFANSERLYPIARWLPRCGNVSSWHCTAQQNPTLSRALRACRRPGGGSGTRA